MIHPAFLIAASIDRVILHYGTVLLRTVLTCPMRVLEIVVGVTGFEPATYTSRT